MSRAAPSSREPATAQPVVILLPGLLCDEQVWRHQRQSFAGWHGVVPSFGTLSSITAMAEHVLAQAPSRSFSLAGHSMGGRVALEVMRLAPHRVERLALADTGADPLAPGAPGSQEREQRMALLQLAQQRGMREMGRRWASGMVHPMRLGTQLFEDILDMIERSTPEVFEAQIQALLSRPDARPVLAGVRCPTLLLCGRQDAWSPLERHQRMHALLPGSRLVVIEDSGHMTPMEQPEAVSGALRAWLAAP
jgi:pimeloyl-ACP methyl ester carboxylesterase